MKRIHWSFAIFTLVFGFLLGTSTVGTAVAVDSTPAAVTAQGNSLKVCIDKKTGVIRASTSCKTIERAYVLGGTGPQGLQGSKGDKGDAGVQGNTGLQGVTGMNGVDGKVSQLKTKSISFLASNTCAGALDSFEIPVVTRVYEYSTTRGYAGQSNATLRGCSVTVYAP